MARLTICLCILITLLPGTRVYCQKETAKWYFGLGAALDFLTNPPTVLNPHPMNALRGCASVADTAGALLFYTDGETVFNAMHVAMLNGTMINGAGAAAQSSIILKKPGSANIYYLFTLNVNSYNPGFYYSEIDMSLAGGLGAVTVKNTPLYLGKVGEKLTGTRHCNGTDFWVVMRDWTLAGSSNFRSYLITNTGVDTNAVVSNAWISGNSIGGLDYGCMKISPNGKKLAAAVSYYWNVPLTNNQAIELYDFDNTTGVVSNSIALAVNTTTQTFSYGYGVEFSPDCSKLYATKMNNNQMNYGCLCQFDICAGTQSAIAATIYTVVVFNSMNSWGHGSLQLAKNGKIYAGNWSLSAPTHSISIINNPNASGAACGYTHDAQSVGTGSCNFGLPNFIGSNFLKIPPPVPFTYTTGNSFGCQAVGFQAVDPCPGAGYSIQGLLWDFGDPASGNSNLSVIPSPTHTFSSLGSYTVQLIKYYSCGGGSDTIRQVVNVNQPCITVTSTSISCATLGSATVNTNGGIGPFSYTWMPGNLTGSAVTGLSPGPYTVTIHDANSNLNYTEHFTLTPSLGFTANLSFQPSVGCFGAQTATTSVTNIIGGSSSQSYLWTNGTSTFTSPAPILSAGNWSLTITDNISGCNIKKVFSITQPPQLNLALSASSKTSCVGKSATLNAVCSGGSPPFSYSWTAGPANSTFAISQSLAGNYIYTLTIRDSLQCLKRDTISVNFISNPVVTIPSIDICALETGTLQASGANTYLWTDNSTASTFTANPSTTSFYSVVGSAFGCTTSATGIMVVKPLPAPTFSSSSPVCEGQNLDLFAGGGVNYTWTGPQNFTSNSQNPVLNAVGPATSGQYNFTVTAANSCTAASSGSVVVHPTPTLSAAGSTVCVTQNMVLSSSSEPGATFQWTGPQSFSSTQQNPQVLNPAVNMSGNYLVTAHSTFDCSNTAVAHVSVTAVPVPSFVTNSPVCDQSVLTFNSSPTSGGLNFQWTGPDNFTSQQLHPSISPVGLQNAGDYTLTVTAGPCVATINKQVIVNSLPQPSITGPDEVCETKNFALNLSDATHQIVSYYWQYPMGGSGQQNIFVDSVKPYNSGVYSATVTDVNGCKGATSKQITILANPTITAIGDTVCLNAPARLRVEGANSYSWMGKNLSVNFGATAKVSSANYAIPETYVVVGTAVNGCTAITSAEVHTSALPKPEITVRPKNRFCVNEQITLEGKGGAKYEWLTPEGAGYGGQTVALVIQNTAMAGQYTLTVTDPYGCKNSALTTVLVDAAPDGALTGQTWDACAPFCADYKFQPAWITPKASAKFYLDNRLIGTNAFQKCFLTPAEYILTGKLTDSTTGCVNTQTYLVNARRTPGAMFSWEPEKPVETFDEVNFINTTIGEEQNSWTWYIEGKGEAIRSQNTSYTFLEAGTYRVAYIVENKWGCSDTVVKTIEIAPDFSFYMPNAFTPDGDGKNDIFTAVARGVKKYQLQIFNRWGERMFVSNDLSTGWDGTTSDKLCKSETYVWKAIVSSNTGEQKEYLGHVVLIR